MAAPKDTPARRFAERGIGFVHQALKPLLAARGVRAVERAIGRSERFFQKARQRDALRMTDYLATCAVLEEVPGELLDRALEGQVSPEIRRPRIVRTAWLRIGDRRSGPGLGEERLAELEAAVQTDPRQTRADLESDLDRASRRELPLVLALYGTALRLESDLLRAELVLRQAIEMARVLDLPAAEADLLIRLSYVALERYGPSQDYGRPSRPSSKTDERWKLRAGAKLPCVFAPLSFRICERSGASADVRTDTHRGLLHRTAALHCARRSPDGGGCGVALSCGFSDPLLRASCVQSSPSGRTLYPEPAPSPRR